MKTKVSIDDLLEVAREKVELEPDEKIKKTLRSYHKNILRYRPESLQIKNLEYDVLDTEQINKTLQKMIEISPRPELQGDASSFLSKLIQKSYEAGNNNFKLDTQDRDICSLVSNLKGTKDNPIKITINGNTGGFCGSRSDYILVDINGNTEWGLGDGSRNSEYNVQGITEGGCATESKNTKYNLQSIKGHRENGIFRIKMVGFIGTRAEGCTFTTYDGETYRIMRNSLKKRRSNRNKIIDKRNMKEKLPDKIEDMLTGAKIGAKIITRLGYLAFVPSSYIRFIHESTKQGKIPLKFEESEQYKKDTEGMKPKNEKNVKIFDVAGYGVGIISEGVRLGAYAHLINKLV